VDKVHQTVIPANDLVSIIIANSKSKGRTSTLNLDVRPLLRTGPVIKEVRVWECLQVRKFSMNRRQKVWIEGSDKAEYDHSSKGRHIL